jgi:2-oxoglutarate dehydrogenase E1 component
MSSPASPKPGSAASINSWLEEELYQQYRHDRTGIDDAWKTQFETANGEGNGNTNGGGKNGSAFAAKLEPLAPAAPAPAATAAAPAAAPPVSSPALAADSAHDNTAEVPSRVSPTPAPAGSIPAPSPEAPQAARITAPADQAPVKQEGEAKSGDNLVPLKGAAARIAENMTISLQIPTATSQRIIPVKLIDENRRLINQQRSLAGKSKVSYTHLIAYSLVKACEKIPSINTAYTEKDGQGFRVVHQHVNIGLAVDVAGKDGNRSLMVPNIKKADTMNFAQFLAAYDDVVVRARNGKLTVPDFQGTTLSLTNPGTVGTVSSVPRLMPGQGAIIATGAIDYPAEFSGVTEQVRAMLGITKVMGMTCTYDHRVIQGAESGMFLARVQELLDGADSFYENIFRDLHIPYQPVKFEDSSKQSSQALLPLQAALPVASNAAADVQKELAVSQLIHAYRVRGHLIANTDPLGHEPLYHPELDPASYGLSIWDLDRPFYAGGVLGRGPVLTLREILDTLRQTYCARIGCEYMMIQHPAEKQWLQSRMEPTANLWKLEPETQRRIAERLIDAEEFERFLDNRFKGAKRFSVEGGESTVAVLDELLERAANSKVHEAVIGMAHRGRLTVLTQIVGKSMQQLFGEFEGDVDPDSIQGSGDVKYHLGATGVRRSSQGREITVSVAFNPSHLEAVNPVVEGIVRPKQDRLGDTKRERVIPVLIHGDAAFAGQGVVAETLNLSQLEGYSTGGTIHLVINNQIGFTTNPIESRSSTYCTDVARTVQAPIFHVNGDDPEACIRVIQLAYDFRQQFKKDVVIDMICYRKHGHNETDDPSYTQPLMYKKIKEQESVVKQYTERLVREKVFAKAEVEAIQKRVVEKLNLVYDEAQRNKTEYELQEVTPINADDLPKLRPQTTIDAVTVERVLTGVTSYPEGFKPHPKLKTFLDKRRELVKEIPTEGGALDWATGEALAFGSLVLEGTPVRLSGQDVGRGTFSQRHLELYDYETGKQFVPMKNLAPDQARFEVWDSSLSEYAVMGFEFGYSVADPLALVMWEAQFGDFVNGAQIMIDQFISSAESKWGQPSGLVLMLPHGQEGQGPEHSSARMERFLQLCAEDNMIVANCTTPAQYFHILRRQIHGGNDRRGTRKPLIIMTPKSILRSPKAVSPLSEFMRGNFKEILSDPANLDTSRVNRVLICSGKIFYELAAEREKRGLQNVAILRVEQLYPFAAADFSAILSRYPFTAEVCWVQEESKNYGPWRFMHDQIQPLLEPTRRTLRYVGRAESASPAAGSLKRHTQEQLEVIEDAFSPAPIVRRRRVPVRLKKAKK